MTNGSSKSAGETSKSSDSLFDTDSDDDLSCNLFNKLLIKEGKRIGGFAKVYKCKHALDDQFYAIKRIRVNRSKLDWYLREVKALSSLHHKNIVRYYESWTDVSCDGFITSDNSQSGSQGDSQSHGGSQSGSEGDSLSCSAQPAKMVALYLYIQMEFCNSDLDSLFDIKDKISTSQAWKYLHDLLVALIFIHNADFLHRDLTSKNIFIGADENIKIGDFGLAKKSAGEDDNLHCSQSPHSYSIGQALYKAPELKDKTKPYTEKSDLYSMGVIFLAMLLPRYNYEYPADWYRAMTAVKTKWEFLDGWDKEDETAILHLMLAESPDDRATVREVYILVEKQIAKEVRSSGPLESLSSIQHA